MMRIKQLLVLFVLLTSALNSSAQVEMYADTVNGGVGNQVIVPIRANNFTGLATMQGTVHFDETVLDYTTIEQFGLPGLSIGSFGTTQTSIGNITFSWFDSDLSGETVADSSILFALRFTIIGNPGDSSLIWFDNNPTTMEFVNAAFVAQPFVLDTGLVIVDSQPTANGLSLYADSLIANQNDTVVVPIRVLDFDDIIGVQGTIGFDPSVADYVTVEQFGVPGMTIANFGETQVGIGNLTFSWNAAGTSGVSLADSAVLFAVKYHMIGSGGSNTDISFLGAPTPMEIVDSNLVVLTPYLSGGYIEIEPDTNQLFRLIIDTVIGQETQLVNVPIRSRSFTDIISMQGTFGFDTSVISYSSVANFNLPDLNISNFGTTQVANGLLSFSWFDQDLAGETYPDSTILFELVFQVDGAVGDFGEVIMNSEMTPIEIVELGNLIIPYELDSGGVLVDSLGLLISLADPVNLSYCAGDSISLTYQGNVGASSGNIYTLELSDALGSFASPLAIGTLTSTQDTAVISGLIPSGTALGTGYKLRVNSSLPSITGNPTIANFTIEYYEDSVSSLICFGDSLFLAGSWQTSAGFYNDTLATVNGCDSVVVTNLTFTSAIVDSVYFSICQGDSLFLANDWQSTPGWYVDSLSSVSGCDSLIRSNLTVFNTYNTPISSIICQEDSLFLAGAWQNSSGVYVDTLFSIEGCDSLITTTLSLYPSDTTNLTQSICAGDSVFVSGTWQTVSGSYPDIQTSIFGCDSVVIVNLTVIQPIEEFDTVAVCFGDSLFVEGAWQLNSGDYIDTLTALSTGCDSLLRTNFTVKPQITNNLTSSICAGDSIFVENAWQTSAGSYTDTLTALDGCDSLVIVDVTVIPLVESFDSLTICSGDSLLIHGTYESTAGVYVNTTTGQSGCDSIATFTLSIETHPIYMNSIQLCVGDSSFLEGAWQTNSGLFSDTLSSALGCDSIIQTNLSVIAVIQNSAAFEICSGDSLFLEGSWQTISGIYSDTLTAAAGCDSIVESTLTINPTYYNFEALTICQGDSALLQGTYQFASGTYIDSNLTIAGCDSIIETTLTVTPAPVFSQSLTICQGDSALVFGVYENSAGTYQETVQTAAGCDSINEITVLVNPTYLTQEALAICQGDSALLEGTYQISAGLYYDTLMTVAGCDSVIETNLIVNPTYFTTESLSICQGDSAFLEGSYQMSSGIYSDTLFTVAGCDSVIETNLTVNLTYFVQNAVSICQGDSLLLEGIYQTTSGTYLDTTLTLSGCDSIVETALTVDPAPVFTSSITICQGDSALIFGSYETVAGIYSETVQTAAGCDSINEIDLLVNPSYFEQETFTICQGDSAFLEGAYQTTTGTYLDTTFTINGCDSIVETQLTVNPAPVFTSTIEICDGDSTLIFGVYESLPGIYTETLQTAAGCDSINEIDLAVNPTYFSTDAMTICEGDSILLEGMYQTTSGIYTDTLQSMSSCDSIIETNLTVNPAPTFADAITICDGDSVLVNGNYLSAAGTYMDTLQTASGCDSIVTTTLSVTVIDASVMVNSPTLTANYSSAQSYQWINCDSGNNIGNGTSQSYTAVGNGSFQVLINDQGCSVYSDCYDILDISVSEYELSNVQIYPNPTTDKVMIVHEKHDVTMELRDVYGKIILSREVGNQFTLSLKDYPNGVYFMSLGGKVFRLVKE